MVHRSSVSGRHVGDAGDGNRSANRRANPFYTANRTAAGYGNTDFAVACPPVDSTSVVNVVSDANSTPGSNYWRSAARSGIIGTKAREALLVLRAEPDNQHVVSHDLRYGMLHGER